MTLTYRSWLGVGMVLNKILDQYLSSYRVLARNFKKSVRDSMLGATLCHGMKNVRTGIRITSYGLTKRLPDVRNCVNLCTFLSLQNDPINWFNVSRLFIFLTNILLIIRFVPIVLHFQYRLTIFASQSGIL